MHGVKFAICNELFKGWDLVQTIMKYVKEIGYDAIELAPFTISEDIRKLNRNERTKIREAAESLELEIAGLHWLLVKPDGLHINHPDYNIRTKTKEYLKALAEFCGEIGGKVMVFGSPNQRNIVQNVNYESAWNWSVETFREVSEYASNYNVTLCIEPLRKESTNFINTVEEAVRLIEEVNNDNFKLILDVYAMSGVDKPISEQIKVGSKYLRHFHANDNNKGGPGFGTVNYYDVSKTLKEINYSDYISVEVLREEEDPEFVARKSVENLKKFFRLR